MAELSIRIRGSGWGGGRGEGGEGFTGTSGEMQARESKMVCTVHRTRPQGIEGKA